jgi:hypothetical protein
MVAVVKNRSMYPWVGHDVFDSKIKRVGAVRGQQVGDTAAARDLGLVGKT